MDTRTLHDALMRPETYGEPGAAIGFRETHISRLYFTAHHVYKVKKAVDLGFLNFTTLDRRRFYCQEEVRLNQRSCTGTYIAVVAIRRHGSRISIDGAGEIVEYAVKMRRLPEQRMLTRLLLEPPPDLPAEMRRIGRRIAQLHAQAEVVKGNDGHSDLDTIRFNWRENFQQSAPFASLTISTQGLAACSAYVNRFLEEEASAILRRQAEGFVREGHGDLHAEHICLTDPICIYDCIEFNRRFRVADVAADLAFLLMDLDYRDRRDLACVVLDAYREAVGPDPGLERLLPFYKIYRAWVRGKVQSLLAVDPAAETETRAAATQQARRYFNLALGYLSTPLLLMTCGLMGVGKTTVARGLAKATGGELLRSDVLRKQLAGLPEKADARAPFGAGIYTPEISAKTYGLLLESSLAALAAGRTAVADAAFLRQAERERFAAEANRKGFQWLLIVLDCPAETARKRLDRRQAQGDASDGRRELFDLQAADFEPPQAAENIIRIDTREDVDYNVQLILCRILELDRKNP